MIGQTNRQTPRQTEITTLYIYIYAYIDFIKASFLIIKMKAMFVSFH